MAQRAYIQMDQGTDFSAQIDLQSYAGVMYDLSSATIYAQMRKSYQSTVAYDFTAYVLDPTEGSIVIEMAWQQTAEIESGRYVYDIVIEEATGTRVRAIEGVVTVNAGVTKT